MVQDGQAQRSQARKTIANATKAAQGLVETTLQVIFFWHTHNFVPKVNRIW